MLFLSRQENLRQLIEDAARRPVSHTMQPSTPVTGDQICQQYGLSSADFDALAPNIRALYRAAYCADVLHVEEGANYDPTTGNFVPGPPYNNVGPDVNRFLTLAGAEPGEPWCASFGTTMLLDSGVSRGALPDLAASVVFGWIAWTRANSLALSAPVRGCAGLIQETASSGHWTWVSDDNGDGTVKTIEGNTNLDGSSDGYGVFRRTRPYTEFHCWTDLSQLS